MSSLNLPTQLQLLAIGYSPSLRKHIKEVSNFVVKRIDSGAKLCLNFDSSTYFMI